MDDFTRKFNVVSAGVDTREVLSTVYEALRMKGYNPVNQIVGYILSEDPTYITNYNGARSLMCRLDRDELLQELLTAYLNK
ncbi:MAG: IreB family regulatory phosphoprotein [Oscillospiraceae bacterium]|nr:IreB family regulatory phosphoprotein [Oscillospiraceae bacterium]